MKPVARRGIHLELVQRALVNRLVVELRPTGVGLAQIFQPDLSGVDEGAQMDGVGCVGGD